MIARFVARSRSAPWLSRMERRPSLARSLLVLPVFWQLSCRPSPVHPAAPTRSESTARSLPAATPEPVREHVSDAVSVPGQTAPIDQTSPALLSLPAIDARHLVEGQVSVPWDRGVSAQGTLGVVTSVEAHATQVGVDILGRGGNAADAAVATAFALAVTHPSAGNLGGGGFLLVKMGSTVEAIDFRENAPQALTDAKFWDMIRQGAKGPRAVGVPGTVRGLHLLHARHGALPWADVVAPALKLAREGFALGLRQAQTLIWAAKEFERDPIAKDTFYAKKPWLGVRIVQPRLAFALERIGVEGAAGFYEGATARDLVDSLGPTGLLTLSDLRTYEATVREPLYFDFYDLRVITMPPPSAGGVALTQNLLMLQHQNVAQLSRHGGRRVHLLAEVSRRSQVERQFFVTAPDRLSDEERTAQRQRTLDPMTWLGQHPIDGARATRSSTLHPAYRRALSELPDTTHLSVVDAQGNAVSCTVTLSGSFGALLMTRETGIVLNNSVASFSSMGKNTPIAGERTTSSMAPTFAFLGLDHFLVLGSPGGNTIPNTITQTLLQLALDGDSLEEAIKRPRVHQAFVPEQLEMERFAPLPASVQAQLRAMGHNLKFGRQTMGDANIAAYVDGKSAAVADRREGGLALAVPTPQAPLGEDALRAPLSASVHAWGP